MAEDHDIVAPLQVSPGQAAITFQNPPGRGETQAAAAQPGDKLPQGHSQVGMEDLIDCLQGGGAQHLPQDTIGAV